MSAQTVLFDAPGPKARQRHLILTIVGSIAILAILALALYQLGVRGQLEAAKWTPFLTASPWANYLIPGLIGTLSAAAVSVIAAGILGLLLGIGRLSHTAWVRWISGILVEFFRAVPVLIMMIFLFILFSRNGVFLPSVNPFMAVVIALTVYNGSVIAELVRSGVNALPKGQAEAGLSIGLTPGQTLRSIELPQALVAMLPALMGQLVVVIKDTALGYGITYSELLNQSKNLGAAYSNTLPAYIVAAALFILLNYAMTKLAGAVETRLRKRPITAGPTTTTMPNIVQGGAEPGGPTDDLIEPVHPQPPRD
jgi:glutamate transport system permease protein